MVMTQSLEIEPFRQYFGQVCKLGQPMMFLVFLVRIDLFQWAPLLFQPQILFLPDFKMRGPLSSFTKQFKTRGQCLTVAAHTWDSNNKWEHLILAQMACWTAAQKTNTIFIVCLVDSFSGLLYHNIEGVKYYFAAEPPPGKFLLKLSE